MITRSKPSFLKIKHLKLITPEKANALGVFAECPVLCSPYIVGGYCRVCDLHYSPLVYQVGQRTEAQHYCKEAGGGIYVQLYEDTSSKWRYQHGLFSALVHPFGPIRMGDDHGFQFRFIIPRAINSTTCSMCHVVTWAGVLLKYGAHDYKAVCATCADRFPDTIGKLDWKFRITDGVLSFQRNISQDSTRGTLQLPSNAGVLRRN